jgi:hypothetical protein
MRILILDPLTKAEIWEAVERGPHRSALSTEALQHFADEVKEKVAAGQCKTVEWDSIKDNPPPQLKISPIAAYPTNHGAFGRYWICCSAYG